MAFDTIKRGDLYIANFDPRTGHEQSGIRPALIVSSSEMNTETIGLAIVVPGTTTEKIDRVTKQPFPDVVPVEPSSLNGLSKRTYFLCSHVRSVDLTRFRKRIGRLQKAELDDIEEVLRILMQL